jgi:hypothetical protein
MEKICRKYCLEENLILTNIESKIPNDKVLMDGIECDMLMKLKYNSFVMDIELKRRKYVIIFDGREFIFEAICCNTWNRVFINYYINLLIGGAARKMKFSIDGILLSNDKIAVLEINKSISIVIELKKISKKPEC